MGHAPMPQSRMTLRSDIIAQTILTVILVEVVFMVDAFRCNAR
jgi:hypothetical protein